MPKEGNEFLLHTSLRCWSVTVSDLSSLCIGTQTELGRSLHCRNFFTKASDYPAPGHIEYVQKFMARTVQHISNVKLYQGASSRLALSIVRTHAAAHNPPAPNLAN